MQVGTVVRYRHKYPDGIEIDWIGVVIESGRTAPILVQYSNGMRHWKQPNDLEVICA
jgi:hypothetical protein